MASNREYAYYIRGNKVAIVEKGLGAGICSLSGYSTQTTCEDAGGTWTENATGNADGEYISPINSIADGLEIEYTYSPMYRRYTDAAVDENRFYVQGWTVIGGYLTFLKSRHTLGAVDWTSSPWDAVITGTSGHTGADTNDATGATDYIVVKGSQRWNGIHRVKTAGEDGQLVTYTKVSEKLPYWEAADFDTNTSEQIFEGGVATRNNLWQFFDVGDYLWISDSANASNEGLYKVGAVVKSATPSLSLITLSEEYQTHKVSNVELEDMTTEHVITGSSMNMSASTGSSNPLNLYKAYRDFCYFDTDVDALNDENDEVDVSRYQANAIVNYVKARYAEDLGDLDRKEYFMREFRMMVEKYDNGRTWGSRKIQGSGIFTR